jgi:hypothetical protein
MLDTYLFLTGIFSIEDAIEEGKHLILFAIDPYDYDKNDIQDVIDFFADLDEFEKCITLKKIKDELGNEKSN